MAALSLSTSDWIAIVVVIVQVFVAVGIAVHQARQARLQPKLHEAKPSTAQIKGSNVAWYFKNAWGFLVGIPMSIAYICWEAVSPGPTTVGSALALVFLSLWLAFNVLLAIAFALAAPFRQAYAKLQALTEKSGA